MAAFSLARKQEADGVELDVRLARDERVVVMHDSDVARTTDGRGLVAELTAAELQALDAGEGEPVPTLDDLFEAFGPTLLYNVELKDNGLWDDTLALAVADRVAAHNLENEVVISSFNPLAVRRARRHLAHSAMVALLWHHPLGRLLHHFVPAEADHPHHTLVDEAYIQWARARGYRVHVWTVDDPAEAQRLASLGVDAIITNYPARIRGALRR